MTKKQAKPRSRKMQGEETRTILIRTGARLFARNGYHGVSMRTLAAEAEVNLATVSYHFGGKAGLYEAILQELIDLRNTITPPADEVKKRAAEAGDDPQAKGECASWFVNSMVHGMLGREQHIWPAFIISRELAQPTELFPKMEKEFFNPAFDALRALTTAMLPDGTDNEELVITGHAIIGMIVKFLEGYTMITKRLDWDGYDEYAVNKIATVLSTRIRGFFGLPMENA